jgi:hypothetical protein
MLPKALDGRAQAVIWLAIGLALLGAGVAAIYFSTRNDLLTSYRDAPACTALDDALAGKDCRYTATATVTEISGDPGGSAVFFDLPGSYSPFYWAVLPRGTRTDSSLSVGSQVQVELWRYRVTRLAGEATAANPENDPRPGNLLAIGGLLSLLGLAAGIAAGRAWRVDHSQPARVGEMNPVATSDALWH